MKNKRVLVKCLNKGCNGKRLQSGTASTEWNYQPNAWFQVIKVFCDMTIHEWCPKCQPFKYLWRDTDD